MTLRDNLKQIMRQELPFTFGNGAVESIIGLHDVNYNYNSLNEGRIQNLENNESIFQVFAYVARSTSGQIPVYTESSIFDIYSDGILDAIVVAADENNKPIEEFVYTSANVQVTVSSLSVEGNYVLSGIPTRNACILYFLKIRDNYKSNIPESVIIPPVLTNKDIHNHQNSTGILYFGGLSINVDNTKFNVGRVIAEFVDNTDPQNISIQEKDFAALSGVSVTQLANQNVTYIGINILGEIIQSSTPFTPTQRRDIAQLGVVVHSNRTTINAVNNQPEILLNVLNQFADFLDALRVFNVSGNTFSNNGTDLRIKKSAGYIFKKGVNYINDPKNPHQLLLNSMIPTTFRYRLQNGIEYADTTNINPGQYDLNGVLTNVVTSSNYTVQRIYVFQSNIVRIQYGQALYTSKEAAVAGIRTEAFITEQNISENGLLRGFLVLRQNVTNLSLTDNAIFVEADRFGSAGGSGGTSATTLQSAYDNGKTIITDTINDGIEIQRGSAADTDKLLKFKNGAGGEVDYVTGEGFKGIRYRDEYVGGDWVSAAGAAAPDLVSYTIGGVGTTKFSFDGNNIEERISNSFEMPHDLAYDELNSGTLFVEVHVHWRPTTNNTGNVQLFFDYSYDPANNGAPIPQTSLSVVAAVAANQQYYHKIDSFVNGSAQARLPMPSTTFKLGDLINFTLRRTPSGTNDTYPDDIILEKVALHVPTNDFGSRQIYVK